MSKTSLAILVFAWILVSPPAVQAEMLGPLSRESLFERNPEWQAVAAAYQPKPDCVEKLRALGREVKVEIFLGTWCTDSKAHVSEYFKILDLADTPLIQTACTGIPEAKENRSVYYQGRDIVKLPTFLVFVDGREIGRIVETPEKSVEEDLVKILGL